MAGWIKVPLGTDIGLDPVDVVLDGGLAPSKGVWPQFSAHVYCGKQSPISAIATAELL